MCASLQSAEYAELRSLEEHACESARMERLDGFDPWSGSWYRLILYHCCRRVWSERTAADPGDPREDRAEHRYRDVRKERSVAWRETEPYLSSDYLDHESGELLDLISFELPFERARDGNVTAWVLRAEHAGVITAADRMLILAGLRAAREKREKDRGLVV